MNSRMRWLVEIPQADAKEDSYADESGFVLVYDVALSSSRPRLSNAVVISASAPRAEMSKALAALASTVEPSAPAVRGRVFSSALPEPVVFRPVLAVRLGMKRSAALWGSLMVVLPTLDLNAVSFFDFSLAGVLLGAGPVPVNVHSETPRSSCLGDVLPLAMFDLGELAYTNFETDRDTDREKMVEASDL